MPQLPQARRTPARFRLALRPWKGEHLVVGMAGRKGTRWGAYSDRGRTPGPPPPWGMQKSVCRLRWPDHRRRTPGLRAGPTWGIEDWRIRDRTWPAITGAHRADVGGMRFQKKHHGVRRDRVTITAAASGVDLGPWPSRSARSMLPSQFGMQPGTQTLSSSHHGRWAGVVPWALVGIRRLWPRALAGGLRCPAPASPSRPAIIPLGPAFGLRDTPAKGPVAGPPKPTFQIRPPALRSPGSGCRAKGLQVRAKLRPSCTGASSARGVELFQSVQLAQRGIMPCTSE